MYERIPVWLAYRKRQEARSVLRSGTEKSDLVKETERCHAVQREKQHQASANTDRANEGNHTIGIQRQKRQPVTSNKATTFNQ